MISLIIPVYNGGTAFERCLQTVEGVKNGRFELIVVDDGSTDGSLAAAQRAGAQLLHSAQPQSGPAACRNLGAQAAHGEILLFLDADVLIKPDTVVQVAAIMTDGVAACFGSYDETPAAHNFLSQYRNLLHHYTHQTSNPQAVTFWAGCGAVRRDVFWQVGGFDARRYPRPSIEDIELGYRLRAAGFSIRLVAALQVTHLKRWTAVSLLHSDIFARAVPWSLLLLQQGNIPQHLNLQTGQRWSGAAAVGMGTAVFLPIVYPALLAWLPFLVCLCALLYLNRNFYQFLWQKRGGGFLLAVLPWHWLYFCYSTLTFIICWGWWQGVKRDR